MLDCIRAMPLLERQQAHRVNARSPQVANTVVSDDQHAHVVVLQVFSLAVNRQGDAPDPFHLTCQVPSHQCGLHAGYGDSRSVRSLVVVAHTVVHTIADVVDDILCEELVQAQLLPVHSWVIVLFDQLFTSLCQNPISLMLCCVGRQLGAELPYQAGEHAVPDHLGRVILSLSKVRNCCLAADHAPFSVASSDHGFVPILGIDEVWEEI
mmetsp:Transcript_12170/g.26809  ORF Transcript_12170/g.26809 Transcript_12170/m.26809 type:complete len:209 (+) Transcript_12170:526-1152(+)